MRRATCLPLPPSPSRTPFGVAPAGAVDIDECLTLLWARYGRDVVEEMLNAMKAEDHPSLKSDGARTNDCRHPLSRVRLPESFTPMVFTRFTHTASCVCFRYFLHTRARTHRLTLVHTDTGSQGPTRRLWGSRSSRRYNGGVRRSCTARGSRANRPQPSPQLSRGSPSQLIQ